MFATTHVLSGAAIGRRVHNPLAAFGMGVLSHFAMDALPHWGMDVSAPGGRRRFLLIAGIDGLLLSAVLTALVRRGRPASELTGALGALLLDLDKPAAELGIKRLWPDWLHHAHVDIQIWEAPGRWPMDLGFAALGLTGLVRGGGSGVAAHNS